MSTFRVLAFCVAMLLTHVLAVHADEELQVVLTAHGVIHRVDKDSVTIKRRTAEGRFDTDLVLKLTGTSNFSVLSMQKRGDKVVPVQKTIEAKHVVEKQTIAVIYSAHAGEHVLLAAVVQNP